ncbi:MAG: Mce-associated rane protein [Pseudonocardiales bacterium]|nr:Mce-associated rane protein [Pseudonocardiales bacterium]
MGTGVPGSELTEADVTEPDMTEPDVTSTGDNGGAKKRRVLLGVLTALAIAAAGCTGYLALRPAPPNVVPSVAEDGSYVVGSLPTADQARIVASAVRAVPDLLAYDYRSLAATPDRARPHLTPEFAAEYQKTFQTAVVPMATANHAVTKALVRGAGVIDSSADRARCLVFVDQLLVSQTAAPPVAPPAAPAAAGVTPTQVAQNRVLVTLTRHDDTWLVSGLTPF